MTVSQAVPIVDYTGNGVSTVFAFDFRIFAALDLVVTVNAVEVSNYSVTITPQPGFGGSITFAAAPANGAQIRIRRNLALQRSVDYQIGGALPERTLDDDQDAPIMMIQQLAAGTDLRVGSVLRVPDGESVATLPAAGSRAGRVVGFDANGQPQMVVPLGGGVSSGVNVLDEGVALGSAAELDFVGADVTASMSAGRATVNVSTVTNLPAAHLTRPPAFLMPSFFSFSLQSDGIAPGYTSTVGTTENPGIDGSNPVRSLGRELRASGAVAGNVGWSLGTSISNPRSFWFPGQVNESGFDFHILAGFESPLTNDPLAVTFVMGAVSSSGVYPDGANPLNSSASGWMGLYMSLGTGLFNFGCKVHGSTSILNLATFGSLSLGPHMGFAVRVRANPDRSTSWWCWQLTGLNTFTLLGSGVTSGWLPSRQPFYPCFMVHKTDTPVLRVWHGGAVITPFRLGPLQLIQ